MHTFLVRSVVLRLCWIATLALAWLPGLGWAAEPPGEHALYLTPVHVMRNPFAAGGALAGLAQQLAAGPPSAASIQQLEQLLAMDRGAGVPGPVVADLLQLGALHARAGDFGRARTRFAEALSISRNARLPELEAAAAADLGVVDAAQGDYPAALRGSEAALRQFDAMAQAPRPVAGPAEMMQRETTRMGQEATRLNLGAVHTQLGQYAQAYERYRQALALYPNQPAPSGAGTVLAALAATARQLGRDDEATALAQRARSAGPSLLAQLDQGYGNGRIALRGAGAPAAGAGAAADPLTLAQAPGTLQQSQHEGQAAAAEAAGRLDDALVSWRLAAASAELLRAPDGHINALAQLQRLTRRSGPAALAVYRGKRALDAVLEQRSRLAALDRDARNAFRQRARGIYETLADGLLDLGRLAEAEQVLHLLREDAGSELVPGGGTLSYSAAERRLLAAEAALLLRWRSNLKARDDLRSRYPYLLSLPTDADYDALHEAQLDQAEQLLARLEATAVQPQASMAMQALFPMLQAMIVGDQGSCAKAPTSPRQAALAARLERLRNSAGPAAPAYPGVPGLPAVPGLRPAGSMVQIGELRCLYREQLAIERELTRPESGLAAAFVAEPTFASDDVQVLEARRRTLGVGRVELLYLSTDARLRLLLVSNRERIVRDAPVERRTLEAKSVQFRRQVQDPRSDPRSAAQELHRWLIEPVQSELDRLRPQTLVLAPDASLRALPFAALHDGTRWLVERWALTVGGGRSDVKGTERPWRVAAFGNSVGGAGLAALPGVSAELRGIVRDESGRSAAALPGIAQLDSGFTAASLRAALGQRYSVVHLASHFVLVPGGIGESYLLLGDGSRLTLRQIRQDFRFDGVELLTLSACQTALDDIDAYGQEFEGLAAVVRNQGAGTVMATLWPVADESTARLMQRFYAVHEERRLSIAEALRSAQVELLEAGAKADSTVSRAAVAGSAVSVRAPSGTRFAHPYYWAPFVLTGSSL